MRGLADGQPDYRLKLQRIAKCRNRTEVAKVDGVEGASNTSSGGLAGSSDKGRAAVVKAGRSVAIDDVLLNGKALDPTSYGHAVCQY